MIGDFSTNENLSNLIYRNYESMTEDSEGFEIYSAINIDNDIYVTVIKNGYGNPKGGINHNQKICRISLLRPEYIYYDEMFTKQEKEWFINAITINWNNILEDNYSLYHDWLNNTNYNRLELQIPDYSNLETAD